MIVTSCAGIQLSTQQQPNDGDDWTTQNSNAIDRCTNNNNNTLLITIACVDHGPEVVSNLVQTTNSSLVLRSPENSFVASTEQSNLLSNNVSDTRALEPQPGNITTTRVSVTRKMISRETLIAILTVSYLIVGPIFAIVGLPLNVISAIIIRRSGLQKSSNILLFTLAIADFCTLLDAVISFASGLIHYITQTLPMDIHGWTFPYKESYACFVVYRIAIYLSGSGSEASTSITVLITIERLIAVFCPLRFVQIVTPKRVWIAVVLVIVFWLPWHIFEKTLTSFLYIYSPVLDLYLGLLWWSPLYSRSQINTALWFQQNVILHLSHTFCIGFVILGYIIIGIKVSRAHTARKSLTAGSYQNRFLFSRTMKTMMTVCVVFSLCRVNYMFMSAFDILDPAIAGFVTVYNEVSKLLLYLNSASNFFIYVTFNNKFRVLLLQMFCGKIGKTEIGDTKTTKPSTEVCVTSDSNDKI